MYMNIYLLVIAVVIVHLAAILIYFHIYTCNLVAVVGDSVFESCMWNIYVQCDSHICSVIYVKYVYMALVALLNAVTSYVAHIHVYTSSI